jgi:hypothetical protein
MSLAGFRAGDDPNPIGREVASDHDEGFYAQGVDRSAVCLEA